MRQLKMRISLAACFAAALLAVMPAAGVAEAIFPRPPELEPLIQFWIEIFTELDRDRSIIHDKDNPGIRYETVSTSGMSDSERDRFLRKRRQYYAKLLENLNLKDRERWTREERHISDFFPKGCKKSLYLEAASRIRSQRGIRDRFREGLIRSGRWRDAIEAILASYDIPKQLAALPHIESSFDPRANSSAGAAGIWQFTTSTGRKYLRIDRHVDERRDIYISTHAAARYLRDAHSKLGSWALTVTSYNHGVNGMMRAKRELGTSDIGRLIREYDGPYFGFASKNFYAEFLAALEVLKHQQRYFGDLQLEPTEKIERFIMPSPSRFASLVNAFETSKEDLRRVNPALSSRIVRGRSAVPSGTVINVPELRVPDLADAFFSLPEEERSKDLEPSRYRVKWGDTLLAIARRHGVSVADLQAANGLGRSTKIKAGQRLKIPPRTP